MDPEDNIEDEENLAFLPADHPLYQRLQNRLTKQLTDEHERVDLELIEVEGTLKKIERDKEDVGVRLYSVQQQLAENQMNFEQSHENYNLVQRLRIEAEQKQKVQNESYGAKKKEADELRKKYFKSQDELSKLTRTLHQISQYNDQMKGQIQVTKRTTYRAEENVVGLEGQKRKQDVLIDNMNEEIKRLTEQKTILTAQLISQKEETDQGKYQQIKNYLAKSILKEAHLEMQKIIASKKNLLERWQKSLMTMQRMDTALQAIKDALNQQKEMNIQIGTELNGVSQEIRKEAETSEQLQFKNQRLKNEYKMLEQEKQKLEESRTKLQAQMDMLRQSLKTTEEQKKRAEKEFSKIEEEMSQIETNIMRLHTETKKLWEDLVHKKSEHTTIEKTAANLNKQAQQIEVDVEEKNVELENLLNEIIRVKIDKLNTESQIEVLQNKKKEVVKEKEQKDLTVIVYETQIRTGHDLNEKKQHEVGRLNKLHDELMSQSSDVSRGPLEATKNNWKRKTEELKDEIERMHRDWIKKQEQLVRNQNNLEKIDEEVSNQKTKETILQQKKLRYDQQYSSYEREIKEIQTSLKNLRNDMETLNDQIFYNQEKDRKLENEYFNIHQEFTEKLKTLEKNSVKLEVEIDNLKEQKANLLSEIVEMERQILLWERKIMLEEEMQEALDPNVGQAEINELKREIHRMELRLEDLRKNQENIIADMERAVDKRETIQLKYQNKGKPVPGQKQIVKPDTTAALHKQVSNLKNTLNQTTQNSKSMDQAVRQKQAELETLNQQIEEANEKLVLMESDVHDLNVRLSLAKLEKTTNVYRISSMQGQAKKYTEIVNRTSRLAYPEAQLRIKHQEQREVNENIREALEKVLNEHPQYTNLISPLMEIIQDN